MNVIATPGRTSPPVEKLGIIDADFHLMPVRTDPQIARHMSQRWRDYIAKYGMGLPIPARKRGKTPGGHGTRSD
jgi:hypothetical protein